MGHLYAEVWWRGVAGSGEERQWRSRARTTWGKEKNLIGRACMSARGEGVGKSGKRCRSSEKAYSKECAKGT
jgi:hypothetical protein